MTTEDERREAAIQRLKRKRGFASSLVAYVVVNVFLVVVWLLSGGGYFWPGWVLAGWGVGLLLHGWSVYGERGITEDDIRREMERGQGSL